MFRPLCDRVAVYCEAHGLLQPGTLVVAVSGGADSLGLLAVLVALRERFGLRLHVATLDHGLRGSDSAADAEFVHSTASGMGMPCTVGTADVPALAARERIGIEAAARQARYDFLTEIAEATGAFAVATGHQRGDQAETVLLHLVRGAGLAGLRGMLPKSDLTPRITLIRPLLAVSRAEIEAALRELNLVPRQDITNADTDYTRNYLRHEILPRLATLNPAVEEALSRLAETTRDDYADLLGGLPLHVHEATSAVVIERAAFLGLSRSAQRLWLREAARRAAQGIGPEAEISFERVEAAVQFAADTTENGGVQLGGGLWLRRSGERLIVEHERTAEQPIAPSLPPGAELRITEPGVYSLPDGVWVLEAERLAFPGEPDPQDDGDILRLRLPADTVTRFRSRQPGDRFRVAEHSTKKLADVLINDKVPRRWRDKAPLCSINAEIAAFFAPISDPPEAARWRVAYPYFLAEPPNAAQTENDVLWRFCFRRR